MALAKRETVNVRLSAEEKMLLERAAKISGKTQSSFLLEHAMEAAKDAVINQRFIAVSNDVFEDAYKALNEPGKANPALTAAYKREKAWS